MRTDKVSAKGFKPSRMTDDVRFGKKKLFKDPSHNFYICLERYFDNKEEGDKIIEGLEKKMNNPNLYYVPPTDYDYEEISQFCSTHHKLRIFHPLAEEDLGLEIKKRQVSLDAFSNQEMTILMYSVIFGMAHLQELGYVHGQLQPHWIAKTTTGYAVMQHPLFNPFGVVCLTNKKELYLSPEAFRAAKYMKVSGRDFNLVKSDVFSAGMVILEAGIMRSLRDVYGGRSNTEILIPCLERKLEILDERYPENVLLRTTLRKMLDQKPKMRPDFTELRRKLPDFRDIVKYFNQTEDSFPNPELVPVKKISPFDQKVSIVDYEKPKVKFANRLRRMPTEINGNTDANGRRSNLKSSMAMGPSRPISILSGNEGVVEPMVQRPVIPRVAKSNTKQRVLNVRYGELRTPPRPPTANYGYVNWQDLNRQAPVVHLQRQSVSYTILFFF